MLENIKVSKTNEGKSNQTSGDKFRVTLAYNDKYITISYHDNYRNESGKEDFLYALLVDANCFSSCSSLRDFCEDFCYDYYEDYGKAKKIYEGCGRQFAKLHFLFTDEEIEELWNELKDY